jgi:hypothetical protein
MTPVSQSVVTRVESIQRGAKKTLFFPLFHRAVTNPEFLRVTRASRIHICTSRTSMVPKRK